MLGDALSETGGGEGEQNEGDEQEREYARQEVGEARAAHHHPAYDLDEVGDRKDGGEQIEGSGQRLTRRDIAREQNGRQEREQRELEGLPLGLRNGTGCPEGKRWALLRSPFTAHTANVCPFHLL